MNKTLSPRSDATVIPLSPKQPVSSNVLQNNGQGGYSSVKEAAGEESLSSTGGVAVVGGKGIRGALGWGAALHLRRDKGGKSRQRGSLESGGTAR